MNTFVLTLRKYLADNRRRLLLTLSGLVALTAICGFLLALAGHGGGGGQAVSMMVYLSIFGCVFASLAFGSMKTPRGRTATLMTPAPQSHKFLVRWIVAVPASALLLWGGFWFTELVRVGAWPLFNDTATRWLNSSTAFGSAGGSRMIFLSIALAAQAFFFLGAIVWPKHSFIKSILAGWAVSTLCTVAMAVSDNFLPSYAINYKNYDDPQLVVWGIISLNVMLAVILYGIAYLRFKESDVADHLI